MIEVLLLSVALAMDSMTVSIVNGIKYKNYGKKEMFLSSFSFGLFQGLMPLLGYLIFYPILSYVEKVDHWIVLIVLSIIGINMIKEAFDKEFNELINEILSISWDYDLKNKLYCFLNKKLKNSKNLYS